MSEKSMYEIGIKTNTDKIYHHRYDRFYPIFLERFRNLEISMCELGVYHCESAKMWKEYFPKAKIFGVDNDETIKCEHIDVIHADQSKDEDVEKIVKKIGKCDFIIDDATHYPQSQYKTFLKLFDKSLKHGGVYIIEDIECNYWRNGTNIYGYVLNEERPLFDFFEKCHNLINQEFTKKENNLEISTVTFAHNCIIITKRTEEEMVICKKNYRFESKL